MLTQEKKDLMSIIVENAKDINKWSVILRLIRRRMTTYKHAFNTFYKEENKASMDKKISDSLFSAIYYDFETESFEYTSIPNSTHLVIPTLSRKEDKAWNDYLNEYIENPDSEFDKERVHKILFDILLEQSAVYYLEYPYTNIPLVNSGAITYQSLSTDIKDWEITTGFKLGRLLKDMARMPTATEHLPELWKVYEPIINLGLDRQASHQFIQACTRMLAAFYQFEKLGFNVPLLYKVKLLVRMEIEQYYIPIKLAIAILDKDTYYALEKHIPTSRLLADMREIVLNLPENRLVITDDYNKYLISMNDEVYDLIRKDL